MSKEIDRHTSHPDHATATQATQDLHEYACKHCGTVNQVGVPTCYHCKRPFVPKGAAVYVPGGRPEHHPVAEAAPKRKAAKKASAKKKTKKR